MIRYPSKSSFSHDFYAAFRPSYASALYKTILDFHHGPREMAVDLGAGPGIVTRALAPSFTRVIGTDPSPGMLAKARSAATSPEVSNITYHEAAAECLPFVADGQADMVVSGQAAHWFDYPRVWSELSRILRDGGTLAFWGYKDPAFVGYAKATVILDRYAYGKGPELLGDYWLQPGRKMVQNQYRDIKPPEGEWDDVRRIEHEPTAAGKGAGQGTIMLQKKLTLAQCQQYIRTWSSYHAWKEAHPGVMRSDDGGSGDVVDEMFEEMVQAEEDWRLRLDWKEIQVDMEFGSGFLLARKRSGSIASSDRTEVLASLNSPCE